MRRPAALLPPLLAACAHVAALPPPTPSQDLTAAVASSLAPPPDTRGAAVRADTSLRPDPYDPCPSPRCGVAGAAAQVTLDGRRDAVLALVERYVRALNARAPAELRDLLDDGLGTMLNAAPLNLNGGPNPPLRHEGVAVARERVVALHERLFELMDRRGFEAEGLRVLSFDDCRRQACAAEMLPGDWFVAWQPTTLRAAASRGPMGGAGGAPVRMLVRWRDGAPRIVAFNEEFLQGRVAP